MIAILAAAAVGIVSAVLPIAPVEPSTRMRPRVFAAICFAGRTARFIAVAYAPALF